MNGCGPQCNVAVMKFTHDLTKDIYKCCGCGLVREDVECSGIYYCPNPVCTATGSYWNKTKLKSFKDEGGKYYVDPIEVVYLGFDLIKVETDKNMVKAIETSINKWMSYDPQHWIETIIDS